jgi:hypothetical protein
LDVVYVANPDSDTKQETPGGGIRPVGSDDTGDGSRENPYATLETARTAVKDGGYVYIEDYMVIYPMLIYVNTKSFTVMPDPESYPDDQQLYVEVGKETLGTAGDRGTVFEVFENQTLTLKNLNLYGQDAIRENASFYLGYQNGVGTPTSSGKLILDNTILNGFDANCSAAIWANGYNSGGISNEITLQNGSIVMNCTNTNSQEKDGQLGGAIDMEAGTITITGGSIVKNNQARFGAGIALEGGVLNLVDGTISGNSTPAYSSLKTSAGGGGVYMGKGKFTDYKTVFNMSGGTISGNTATWGGAVYLSEYSGVVFNMSGGTISGNNSPTRSDGSGGYGGGIYICKNGKVSISGGTIQNNYAAVEGGGIFVYSSSGGVYLSGDPVISGNTSTSSKIADDIFLPGSVCVQLDDTVSGTKTIGIRHRTDPVLNSTIFAESGSNTIAAGSKGAFFCDNNADYEATVSGSTNLVWNGTEDSLTPVVYYIRGGNQNDNNKTEYDYGYDSDSKTWGLVGSYIRDGSREKPYGSLCWVLNKISSDSDRASKKYTIYVMSDMTEIFTGSGNSSGNYGPTISIPDHVNITITTDPLGTTLPTGTDYNYQATPASQREDPDTSQIFLSGDKTLFSLGEGSKLTLDNIILNGYQSSGNITVTTNLIDCASDGHIVFKDSVIKNVNVTHSGSDTRGGIISLANGSRMEMYSGSIEDNTLSYSGTLSDADSRTASGTISVTGGSTFTFAGGTISGNTVKQFGGAIYVEGQGSSVSMYEGAVLKNNTATSNAGTVAVVDGAEFTLDGGLIENNKTSVSPTVSGGVANGGGGGVYVVGSGSSARSAFHMLDGTIQNNTTSGYGGGGVYIEGYASFEMREGQITGNTAPLGGGVLVGKSADAVMTMTGGTISGNKASTTGGGIYIDTGGQVSISDGEITGNRVIGDSTSAVAGGIYVHGSDTANSLQLSGDPVITQNTDKNAAASNIYLPDGYTIALTDAFSGEAGVTHETAPTANEEKIFAKVATTVDSEIPSESALCFTYDDSTLRIESIVSSSDAYALVWNLITEYCVANSSINKTSSAPVGSDETGTGSKNRPWATLGYAISQLPESGGTITVMDDIYNDLNYAAGGQTDTISITKNVTITSDENVLQYMHRSEGEESRATVYVMSGSMVLPSSGSDLTLTLENIIFDGADEAADTDDSQVKYSNAPLFEVYAENGALTLDHTSIRNVKRTGCATVMLRSCDTAGKTLTLTNDSEIRDCINYSFPDLNNRFSTSDAIYESNRGGAIYAGRGSTVTIGTDCTISGNAASSGGGIYVAKSASLTNNGTISGNTAGIDYSGNGTNPSYVNSVLSASDLGVAGKGGGVYVDSAATFTNSGTISGNRTKYHESASTSNRGGGVYTLGTFVMADGSISGNGTAADSVTTDRGGGIFAGGGSITMTGGSILQNTSQSGGGVYVTGTGTLFTMNAGEIRENTAVWGGGVYLDNASVTMTMMGGSICENTVEASDGSSPYGGGVLVGNSATFILAGDDSTAVLITENTAKTSDTENKANNLVLMNTAKITLQGKYDSSGGTLVNGETGSVSGILGAGSKIGVSHQGLTDGMTSESNFAVTTINGRTNKSARETIAAMSEAFFYDDSGQYKASVGGRAVSTNYTDPEVMLVWIPTNVFYVANDTTGEAKETGHDIAGSADGTGTRGNPLASIQAAVTVINNLTGTDYNGGDTNVPEITRSSGTVYVMDDITEASGNINVSTKNITVATDIYDATTNPGGRAEYTLNSSGAVTTNQSATVHVTGTDNLFAVSSGKQLMIEKISFDGGNGGTASETAEIHTRAPFEVDGGTLLLQYATIQNFTSTYAAVWMSENYAHEVTIEEDSVISGCVNVGTGEQGKGGAIYAGAGTLTLRNRSLIGKAELIDPTTQQVSNTGAANAAENGAGIYVEDDATVILSNVEITGNKLTTADGQGGGIYAGEGTVDVSERVEISDNFTTSDREDNVYLGDTSLIQITGTLTGEIGVTKTLATSSDGADDPESTRIAVVSGVADATQAVSIANMAQSVFESDDGNYSALHITDDATEYLVWTSAIYVSAESGHDGDADADPGDGSRSNPYKTLAYAVYIATKEDSNNRTIYVMDDISSESQKQGDAFRTFDGSSLGTATEETDALIVIPEGKTVHIARDPEIADDAETGAKIIPRVTMESDLTLFEVESSGKLVLKDIIFDGTGGAVTDSPFIVRSGGELRIREGVEICNFSGGMDGDTVIGGAENGGAVYVEDGGALYMNTGTSAITGNYAQKAGGAVYLENGAKIYIGNYASILENHVTDEDASKAGKNNLWSETASGASGTGIIITDNLEGKVYAGSSLGMAVGSVIAADNVSADEADGADGEHTYTGLRNIVNDANTNLVAMYTESVDADGNTTQTNPIIWTASNITVTIKNQIEGTYADMNKTFRFKVLISERSTNADGTLGGYTAAADTTFKVTFTNADGEDTTSSHRQTGSGGTDADTEAGIEITTDNLGALNSTSLYLADGESMQVEVPLDAKVEVRMRGDDPTYNYRAAGYNFYWQTKETTDEGTEADDEAWIQTTGDATYYASSEELDAVSSATIQSFDCIAYRTGEIALDRKNITIFIKSKFSDAVNTGQDEFSDRSQLPLLIAILVVLLFVIAVLQKQNRRYRRAGQCRRDSVYRRVGQHRRDGGDIGTGRTGQCRRDSGDIRAGQYRRDSENIRAGQYRKDSGDIRAGQCRRDSENIRAGQCRRDSGDIRDRGYRNRVRR